MRSVPPNLPSLPPAKAQAIALLANEHADPADLADTISLDPSLSASVLRGANSASSAPVSPVTSVEVAVVGLGVVEVRRIVAAAVLGQGFGGLERSDVDVDEMWRHVIVTALLAERLVAKEQARQAFTAGILHDLGRLVMIASTQRRTRTSSVGCAREWTPGTPSGRRSSSTTASWARRPRRRGTSPRSWSWPSRGTTRGAHRLRTP